MQKGNPPELIRVFIEKGYKILEAEWYLIDGYGWKFLFLAVKTFKGDRKPSVINNCHTEGFMRFNGKRFTERLFKIRFPKGWKQLKEVEKDFILGKKRKHFR